MQIQSSGLDAPIVFSYLHPLKSRRLTWDACLKTSQGKKRKSAQFADRRNEHDLVPDCVSELFVRKGSTHSLRKSDFVLPRFETIRYDKHSVRYLGPFLWSKLTENQRDSPSLRVFINKIK